MPNNPQNTCSTTALKDINGCRSVLCEALEWLKITDLAGNSSGPIPTDVRYHKTERQDHITLELLVPGGDLHPLPVLSRPSSIPTSGYPMAPIASRADVDSLS